MSWLSRNLAKLGIDDWFHSQWENGYFHSTPRESLMNAGGELSIKTITHVGSGATTENLFTIAGVVEILGIYGVVTAIGGGGVGVDDTLDSLKLEVYDGAATALTLANSDLTGNGTVGTLILKDAEDSVKMAVLEADAAKYYEGPSNRPFQGGVLVGKTGTTTYIRANYTGDANTDLTIMWHIRYIRKHTGSVLTAV